MTERWYNYSEIRYTREQVLFLLQNGSLLRAGFWPVKPDDSGYTGSMHGKQFKSEGNFIKATTIIAELDTRITKCGDDGLALEFAVCLSDGDDVYLMQRVADYQHRSYEDVKQGIKSALLYCCGWRRKRDSFKRYCEKYRSRKRK